MFYWKKLSVKLSLNSFWHKNVMTKIGIEIKKTQHCAWSDVLRVYKPVVKSSFIGTFLHICIAKWHISRWMHTNFDTVCFHGYFSLNLMMFFFLLLRNLQPAIVLANNQYLIFISSRFERPKTWFLFGNYY